MQKPATPGIGMGRSFAARVRVMQVVFLVASHCISADGLQNQQTRRIPMEKVIHQTDTSFGTQMETWKTLNPQYVHKFYNDSAAERFVAEKSPQHLALYKALSVIERTDLFRYLALLIEGGVYADADCDCKKPIDEWLPRGVDALRKAIVGVEQRHTDKFDYAYSSQILQWTMAGPAGHPIFQWAVDTIVRSHPPPSYQYIGRRRKASRNHKILYATGPGLWTDAVNQYISSYGHDVDVIYAEAQQQAYVVVGDMVLLEQLAFNSQDGNSPRALVVHGYRGSWKKHRGSDGTKKQQEVSVNEKKSKRGSRDTKKQQQESTGQVSANEQKSNRASWKNRERTRWREREKSGNSHRPRENRIEADVGRESRPSTFLARQFAWRSNRVKPP